MQRLLVHMRYLIALRRALHPQNPSCDRLGELRVIVAHIEAAPASGDSRLRSLFFQEVTVARTMMKLIEIQDAFRSDMLAAIEECDVVELNRLLVRAERLEMGRDPVVEKGRDELKLLHRRRAVMKGMVAFLRNENEYGADPADLLLEAASLGVDEAFISKVPPRPGAAPFLPFVLSFISHAFLLSPFPLPLFQVRRVFEGAGPRLKGRSRLRAAVETVSRRDVLAGLEEIATLQVPLLPTAPHALHTHAHSHPLLPHSPLSNSSSDSTRALQTPSGGQARCCCGCCPSRRSCARATTCPPSAAPRPARTASPSPRRVATTRATGRA